MKKCLLFLLLLCTGCKNAVDLLPDFLKRDQIKSYNKKYIIITDYVNDELLDVIKKNQLSCADYPPDSCLELTLKVYLTTFRAKEKEFGVSFTESGGDNLTNFAQFIQSLEAARTDSGGLFEDKAIIRCISNVISKEMTDPNTRYELLIFSSFLETSGDPIMESDTASTKSESIDFRFVDNGGKVNPHGLQAAIKQLEDSTSTVFQSVVSMATFNRGKTNVYFISRMPDFQADHNYNKHTIMRFWQRMIELTGIRPKTYSSLSDHPFFKG